MKKEKQLKINRMRQTTAFVAKPKLTIKNVYSPYVQNVAFHVRHFVRPDEPRRRYFEARLFDPASRFASLSVFTRSARRAPLFSSARARRVINERCYSAGSAFRRVSAGNRAVCLISPF